MQGTYVPPEEKKDPLQTYCVNLTSLARENKLDPVIGRDSEIRRLIQILSRRSKNNPVLLGDPGVGKTAILEGLAIRIANSDVPSFLQKKELLTLDLASLLAGASYRGQFEERFKGLLKKITQSEGKYLLFIDELHTIIGAGAGGEGTVDAGNMLKPQLARGELRVIGATTTREYRQYIERDPALERRFQPIYVDEPSPQASLSILRGIKEKYEAHHGVKISDSALESAVELSVRYIPDRFLPDKAIDLVDEACSSAAIELDSLPSVLDEKKRSKIQLEIELDGLRRAKGEEAKITHLESQIKSLELDLNSAQSQLEKEKLILKSLRQLRAKLDSAKFDLEKFQREIELEKASEIKYSTIPNLEKELQKAQSEWDAIPPQEHLLNETITSEDIAKVVAKWTNIPTTSLLQNDTQKLLLLEETLCNDVIGQAEATSSLARALRRSRLGLGDINRPIGAFLLLGPTGTGKTETAKSIARTMFSSEKALIRIDMSEYSEAHNVAKLIGAPPGYIGYDEPGQLTEAVRRKPYSVILFDEIEKAHPQVFNLFLQIFDEGRLTDSKGRLINFKNTILLMTSNLGAQELESITDSNKRSTRLDELVKQFFKPEFLNRLDGVLYYQSLSRETMAKIVSKQLQILQNNLASKQIKINFDKSISTHLQEVGYDPSYGARPLKRAINDLILDEIASQLLEEKISEKDELYLLWNKDQIEIRKVK